MAFCLVNMAIDSSENNTSHKSFNFLSNISNETLLIYVPYIYELLQYVFSKSLMFSVITWCLREYSMDHNETYSCFVRIICEILPTILFNNKNDPIKVCILPMINCIYRYSYNHATCMILP